MPFLRLTRDRRGYEHTFLLHARFPGETPRVLYWYRTAPDVLVGRPALDEEAIRTIEEQHPHIEFDWPAILVLREAMPPEEEEERPVRPQRRGRPPRREGQGQPPPRQQPTPARAAAPPEPEALAREEDPAAEPAEVQPTTRGLLEELVGREIATRLRARHSEIMARIHEQGFDPPTLEAWTARADALDPDNWLTPEAVLSGVRDADHRFESLRTELLSDTSGTTG